MEFLFRVVVKALVTEVKHQVDFPGLLFQVFDKGVVPVQVGETHALDFRKSPFHPGDGLKVVLVKSAVRFYNVLLPGITHDHHYIFILSYKGILWGSQ